MRRRTRKAEARGLCPGLRRMRKGSAWYALRWRAPEGKGGPLAWRPTSTGQLLEGPANEIAWRWREEGEASRSGGGGVADRSSRPLAELAAEFLELKRFQPERLSTRYLIQTRLYLDEFLAEVGGVAAGELTIEATVRALERIRTRGRRRPDGRAGGEPLSNATMNRRRSTLKAFSRWMHVTGRLPHDALAALRPWRTQGHERVVRRGMEVDEAIALLRAALGGPARKGMAGKDRWALYMAALATGFRRGELASLRVCDWSLAGREPTVSLSGASAKGKRSRRQPVLAEFAPRLREWLDGRPGDARCWPGLSHSRTAVMVREDLEAAGVASRNVRGERLDFHALRHTYVTQLILQDVPVERVCELARHYDVKLTIAVYNHIRGVDMAEDLARVRYERSNSAANHARATGTQATPTDTREGDRRSTEPFPGAIDMHTEAHTGTTSRRSDSNRQPPDYKSGDPDSVSAEGPEVTAALPACAADAQRTVRGRARDRADAGLEPDVGTAFARIAELGSMARPAAPGRAAR